MVEWLKSLSDNTLTLIIIFLAVLGVFATLATLYLGIRAAVRRRLVPAVVNFVVFSLILGLELATMGLLRGPLKTRRDTLPKGGRYRSYEDRGVPMSRMAIDYDSFKPQEKSATDVQRRKEILEKLNNGGKISREVYEQAR